MKAQKHIIYWFVTLWIVGSLGGCTFNIGGSSKLKPLEETVVEGDGDDKIVVIDISGVIGGKDLDLLPFSNGPQVPFAALIREQLEKAAKDDDVQGVLLRINSPGGEVTITDIVYHELQMFRKQTGKKIVASISARGASGGYYIAMAADKVIAHPTALVGSIGVVMLHFNAQGLLQKLGIENDTIQSGDLKSMGSPFRPMSTNERGLFQEILETHHRQFVRLVARGRNMTIVDVQPLADGRIYTAPQAKTAGLIDDIGYLEDAVETLKVEAGLDDVSIVMYHRPGAYLDNLYSRLPPATPQINLINVDMGSLIQKTSPSFMYLWMP